MTNSLASNFECTVPLLKNLSPCLLRFLVKMLRFFTATRTLLNAWFRLFCSSCWLHCSSSPFSICLTSKGSEQIPDCNTRDCDCTNLILSENVGLSVHIGDISDNNTCPSSPLLPSSTRALNCPKPTSIAETHFVCFRRSPRSTQLCGRRVDWVSKQTLELR